MKEKIKEILMFLIIILLLPYVCSILFSGKSLEAEAVSQQQGSYVETEHDGITELLNVEEYLVGVVAAQMPVNYELEALKAQAVAARTYVYKIMDGRNTIGSNELKQEFMSIEDMERVWGYEKVQEYRDKIEAAVEGTKGICMTYQSEYIETPFHAVSNGRTRNGQEAFGDENYQYLKSAENGLDLEAENYLKIVTEEPHVLIEKLETWLDIEISGDNFMDIFIIEERDSADYVNRVKIDGTSCNGEEVRKCLSLNSSCFTCEEFEGKIRIITKGLGHGIGMSQYGAQRQAMDGKTYIEILSYYYQNIDFIHE